MGKLSAGRIKFSRRSGLFPRVGFRNIEGGLQYKWNAESVSWWSMFRVGSELNYFEKQDGRPLSNSAWLWFGYSGTMQSSLTFLFIREWKSREMYANHEFNLTYFRISGGFWPTSNLELDATTIFGDQIDYANVRLGKRFRLNPSLTLNIGKHLRLSLDQNFEQMHVSDVRLYTTNISQLSAVYHFNVRTFFRTIIQYVNYDYNPSNYIYEIGSNDKRLFTQLLFSYKINPALCSSWDIPIITRAIRISGLINSAGHSSSSWGMPGCSS